MLISAGNLIAILQAKASSGVGQHSVTTAMDRALRDLVRQRAGNWCEYCGIHQNDEPFFQFHIEQRDPSSTWGRDGGGQLGTGLPPLQPSQGAEPQRHRSGSRRYHAAVQSAPTAMGRSLREPSRVGPGTHAYRTRNPPRACDKRTGASGASIDGALLSRQEAVISALPSHASPLPVYIQWGPTAQEVPRDPNRAGNRHGRSSICIRRRHQARRAVRPRASHLLCPPVPCTTWASSSMSASPPRWRPSWPPGKFNVVVASTLSDIQLPGPCALSSTKAAACFMCSPKFLPAGEGVHRHLHLALLPRCPPALGDVPGQRPRQRRARCHGLPPLIHRRHRPALQ